MGLAAMAALGTIAGQAFGQGGPIVVGAAPVQSVPPDDAGVELNAPPNTLNAQYAALSRAPAPQSRSASGPAVEIAPQIVDAAGAFATYMRKAGAIDPKFADGGQVAKAVVTGSGYEIGQFQQGMVAYAALVALQEPDFVQAVYDLGRDAGERDDLADRLLADPRAVLEVEGAGEAAATVGGVLAQMGAELVKSGQGVKQAAYDVQHQAWSKEAAPNPQGRLAETKQISAARTTLSADDTDGLIQAVVSLRKAGGAVGGRGAAPSPVVLKGLALAALAVIGRAGEEDMGKLEPLLAEAKSADCMKMAKLNLYQCLAVAGPHYEHAYCLAQHALTDTGQCVVSAAGQSPIPVGVQPVSAAKRSRSVSVPIALGSPAGPERSNAYARPPVRPAPEAPPPAPLQTAPPLRSAEAEPPAVAEELETAPPPEIDRGERYAEADRYDDRDDRYRPRDDRYGRFDDRYDRDDGRDRWERQDYDPYGPPELAYRYRR